jgi:L-ascorbate metabolism protein UlaG (beta-lactamase superfamily)
MSGTGTLVIPVAMTLSMLQSCSNVPTDEVGSADLMRPRIVDNRFKNPAGSPVATNTWRDALSLWWKMAWVSPAAVSKSVPVGHVLPEPEAIALLASLQKADTITWLGHASFLIRLGGKAILTDPYLSDYASPVAIGPKRYVQPGISVERLPPIDVLLISHNHYDHLDRHALARLPHRERISVVVPLGVADGLRDFGFREILEVTWGQISDFQALRVTAVPAIHFSGRGLRDGNKTLWAGFMLSSGSTRIYFAGDTGYHGQLFKQMRQAFGPVDVALVPIGAYEPRNLMADIHVDPEEAVAVGRDIGATNLVAMHWGTVVLATEPPFEPPTRFRAAGRAAGYSDDALWVMQIGQTKAVAGR